jgi:hypothetical protein
MNGKLTGAVSLAIGKQMDIVLLGGDHFMKWKDDFWDFCIGLMQERGCESCTITGRKGFKRIFPKLKPVGIVYEYRGGVN